MPIYKLFVSIFHFWYQYNTASIWDDVKNGEPPLKIYLWQKTVENCTGCYISLPSHEEGHWKWDLRIHWKRVWNKLKYWNNSLARGEPILQILEVKWLSHKPAPQPPLTSSPWVSSIARVSSVKSTVGIFTHQGHISQLSSKSHSLSLTDSVSQ